MKRRALLKGFLSLGILGSSKNAFSKLLEDSKTIDLSKYQALPWGRGSITEEDILKNDVKGIKKKISTPAEALSWLGFLNNYKHTVEVNLPVDLWSMSRYENIRKGLYSFHTEMQIQLEFRRLSLKYAGIKDRNLNVKEILGEDNYHKIMNIFNDNGSFYLLLLSLTDYSEVEIKELVQRAFDKKELDLSIIDRIKIINDTEKIHLKDIFKKFSPKDMHIPVCEDVSFMIADLLLDNHYSPLLLFMSGMSGQHVVNLFKSSNSSGEVLYGYIGYDPSKDIHYKKPKFKSVKEMMKSDFFDFHRAIVLDVLNENLLEKTRLVYNTHEDFFYRQINVEDLPY